MRINDPSLWPEELGDLHFAPQVGAEDDEVIVMSEHGVTLALLFRHDRSWTDLTDRGEDIAVKIRGGWELVLVDGSGKGVGRQALFQPDGVMSTALGDDIIAWATLTILSRLAGRCPGRG